jgi:hypothetical protein
MLCAFVRLRRIARLRWCLNLPIFGIRIITVVPLRKCRIFELHGLTHEGKRARR